MFVDYNPQVGYNQQMCISQYRPQVRISATFQWPSCPANFVFTQVDGCFWGELMISLSCRINWSDFAGF